ncbi:hypothetical protein BDR22DRAFT_840065 [Usnea florida]
MASIVESYHQTPEMGKKRKELSQAEIWDDSALLRSWDDALAEYKFYHSIHARGERVEDAIKDVEAQEPKTRLDENDLRPAAAGMQSNVISSKELEDGELEESESAPHLNRDSTVDFRGPSSVESEQTRPSANSNPAVERGEKRGMPLAVINDVKDEALKNLMMSWYYAGYYTGLYEGQQQVENTLPFERRG